MHHGFYTRLGEELDPTTNAAVHRLSRALLDPPLPGITDVIPSYTAVYVEYDLRRISDEAVHRWVEERGRGEVAGETGRKHLVPVVYDGQDLDDVAAWAGLARAEVIERHAAPEYLVYAVGFTAGFPFMGEVDPAIRAPRRAAPRQSVPAHSLALAKAQTGIYPMPSPGGWNLLGHTLVSVFDPRREEPFLLAPGDRVSFRPGKGRVPAEPEPLDLLPAEPARPFLQVIETGLLDLPVDQGRFLAGRFGLARSGPLDAAAAAHANALAGNPADALLVEISYSGPKLEAMDSGVIAFAGWGLRPVLNGEPCAAFTSLGLRRGDRLSFVPTREGARAYLAVTGGIETASFLGSASADPGSRIGRRLAAGDLLGTATVRSVRPGYSFRPYRAFRNPAVLRVLPGPQASLEALRALSSGPYTVTSANRMGIRLDGPEAPGGETISEAAPIGAVQVTPSGQPVILLNDRGTIGGYAKPALVHPADLPRVAQLRPGGLIRFELIQGLDSTRGLDSWPPRQRATKSRRLPDGGPP
jgi:KipI family sensor histidine kinase inhibitor